LAPTAMTAGAEVGLGAGVAVGAAVATAFVTAAVARAAEVVAAAFDSVAVAVGFGVGVTRTWKPPQASMANSHIANAKNSGQYLCLRFIFASERVTESWKLEAGSQADGSLREHRCQLSDSSFQYQISGLYMLSGAFTPSSASTRAKTVFVAPTSRSRAHVRSASAGSAEMTRHSS
jgi:hypothetical protein